MRYVNEALRVVETLPVSSFARVRARGIRLAALARHRPTRLAARYESALRLARLILFHLAPNMKSGDTPLLALLFDMNDLWERYVAKLARRLRLDGLTVHTQDDKPFWRPHA
jgi:5-methylcytosine-specific restriction enzyme subunit McrC